METQNEKPLESLESKSFGQTLKGILVSIKNVLGIFWHEIFAYPLYIITHPMLGWQIFKQEKKGKMWAAITILFLYVIMKMVEYKYAGPVVNNNNPHKFNSLRILVYGIMPAILLSVANWSVTTLMDGKGKMKEIFMLACYSFHPVMVIGFFNIVVSNFVTVDEAQFVTLLKIIGWVLCGYMALTGLISIHEYGLGKVLFSVLLTILATAIIVFIALLIFNLAEQIYGFFYQLYDEFSTRYM